MIAGTNSGCGKTTVTCAVLQALVNRKINVSSFKCGPDYIDPMFHKTVIGTAAYNLDTYLMSNDTVNYLLNKNSGDIAVIEGVMTAFLLRKREVRTSFRRLPIQMLFLL